MVLYSLTTLRVDRKRLYMYKRDNLGGGVRPHLLKINTAVDEDIKCQFGTKLEKDPSKDKKNEKAK